MYLYITVNSNISTKNAETYNERLYQFCAGL